VNSFAQWQTHFAEEKFVVHGGVDLLYVVVDHWETHNADKSGESGKNDGSKGDFLHQLDGCELLHVFHQFLLVTHDDL